MPIMDIFYKKEIIRNVLKPNQIQLYLNRQHRQAIIHTNAPTVNTDTNNTQHTIALNFQGCKPTLTQTNIQFNPHKKWCYSEANETATSCKHGGDDGTPEEDNITYKTKSAK